MGTRLYPATNAVQKEMFPLVDRDGVVKPVIQIIAEEVLAAGIEELCMVVQPGMQQQFQQHFQELSEHEKPFFKNKPEKLTQSDRLGQIGRCITYVEQETQEGYGHAVFCSREWVGNEHFLLLLGDHLYISNTADSCTAQLIKAYNHFHASIYTLQQTPLNQLHLFGTAAGDRIEDYPSAYKLNRIIEKPDRETAKKMLSIPGLPRDHFLCFFGMQILTPAIFDILQNHIDNNKREKGEIQLTTALAELLEKEGLVGLEMNGRRLDMGTPPGYIQTQIALARHGIFSGEIRSTC